MHSKMTPIVNKDLCRVGLILVPIVLCKMANTKEKWFVINKGTLMDCIQNYKCTILVHISLYIPGVSEKKYAKLIKRNLKLIALINHNNPPAVLRIFFKR